MHLDTERMSALRCEGLLAHLDHAGAGDAGLEQREQRLVGLVAVHEERRPLTHGDAVVAQKFERGAREHHAGGVIAGESNQPLERTRGQHHAPRAHDAQPLAQPSEAGRFLG